MLKTKALEIIKNACLKTNDQIKLETHGLYRRDKEGYFIITQIQLPDVLLALQGSGKGFWSITDGGTFIFNGDEYPDEVPRLENVAWNLKETTENQKLETLEFLAGLLK